MDNDSELIKRAIEQLALALLYQEYGKDMKNADLIRCLADGKFGEFMVRTGDSG